MARKSRAAILPTNIILLQNLVKRDPESYKEEFLQQYTHYTSLRDIFLLEVEYSTNAVDIAITDNSNNLSSNSNSETVSQFVELIGFLSSVCQCYPKEASNFPVELKQLLLEHHQILPFEIKEKCIQCLTMMRNKNFITPDFLIQVFFPLLVSTNGNISSASASDSASSIANSHSKLIREMIYKNLVQLLKNCNVHKKNQKLNKTTQAMCFNLLETSSNDTSNSGIWACRLTRELWKRGIWDDSRTVEIMTMASLNEHDVKIVMSGVLFFLDADKERDATNNEDENGDDSDSENLEALKHRLNINKKTGKRAKKLTQAVKTMKKKSRNMGTNKYAQYLNFSALHLLRDPQGFAEMLFKKTLLSHNQNKFKLEQKISILQLLSRLIGTHKLMVLNIYTYFLKYLTPKQLNVTLIMAAAAQSCHDMVPPENIHVMVRKIADEFVSEGVSSEVASAGLNTIREICSRAPLSILNSDSDNESALLQDLTEYKGSKSKAVAMAAKSLISLYREIAPELLKRKDRGKVISMELQEEKKRNKNNKKKDSDGTNDNDDGDNKQMKKKNMPQFGIELGTVNKIEGLELLAKWQNENTNDVQQEVENDDSNWEVVENDSIDSSDDDDEDGWINVDADQEEIEIEMSEEEGSEKGEKKEESINDLVSTRILTPADFAKLQELKTEQGIRKIMGMNRENEDEVDSTALVGPVKYKQLREEKLAKVMEGREGREKYGSRKGKRENQRSTTNREKERKKNFVMMIHKRSVQGKRKMSLRDRQKVLKAHITKQKKKGH
ncbi:related to Protein SDA1 [Saccharomycodes ludwigii]|uniref:Protein SDA1 n=1 Tax=Saccharomycodes ludwigii TaxID=36035 RepID=A0A376B8Q3_9ASCO|nr:hypothetical protein SCDLUD_004805 [Saccharomycodes ludwigii]KAH3899364.1 hypothetical protein SCDLUD_004805 [Saccharomycodes ludwigii]SSD61068.1 related to Protein SDA1 [Saccharomycodes ludwigii]